MLNCERLPCPSTKVLVSDCLRKASKRGFESRGSALGDGIAVDRIVDDGGLPFVFA